MKDIGYYAGFLSAQQQNAINTANTYQLADLLSDLSCEIYGIVCDKVADEEVQRSDSLAIKFGDFSDLNKLELIRGLCDHLEQKLMEAAK